MLQHYVSTPSQLLTLFSRHKQNLHGNTDEHAVKLKHLCTEYYSSDHVRLDA